jgi:hypothetical protein
MITRNEGASKVADEQAAAATGNGWVGVARRAVASYQDHADAVCAVDLLADNRFPVDRVAIVGLNPRLEEKVTGRLSAAVAAGRAAVTGAVIGALLGWLLGVFDLMNPLVTGLWLALNGAILGAILGALLGLLGYAATRGRRSFTSVATFTAAGYQVMVDAEVADQAARLLDRRATSAPAADPDAEANYAREPDASAHPRSERQTGRPVGRG